MQKSRKEGRVMGNINKFIKDFDIKNPYYLQNIVNLRKLLPSDFALAISKVVERSGLTQEEIAECTKVSIDTLKRWKSESDFKVPKIDKLVAFCIGLNLPLEISEELIKNSGTGFQNTVSDMALRVKLRA
ncbi:Transcriptional regulator [Lactococcus lactis subsp. lactis NCDO 2118]|uniref:Transcriptional regulator n=2 Tax=Lactococcus lactis TaxID=1358 RepID=A0ABC8A433_LACLL|nr:Transcriptional regulator, Xre family [Lactococcus lactis subsp. lactis KF147]AII12108.1 Transcriptional regulator [Lactococcus lactis subsp. lactis NCDO 2118]